MITETPYTEVKFVCNMDYESGELSTDQLLKNILKEYRKEVLAFLTTLFDEDWNTYEGGIDSWWGLGSVFLYELGLSCTVKYSSNGITITIE